MPFDSFNPFLANSVLVIAAVVLFYAAFTDLRQFSIRNELILVLAVLFFVHALVSGRWTDMLWNLAFAATMLAVLLYFYSRNLMGGGDAKLLTVAFLWSGLHCALVFAVLLLVFAGLHTVAAKLGWAHSQQADADMRLRIPFAPSIAAALIGVFMLGCLQPLP
jgi:prepilin peptidase CpaA